MERTTDINALKEAVKRLPEDDVREFGDFCHGLADELMRQRQERVQREIAVKEAELQRWKLEQLEKHGIRPAQQLPRKVKGKARPKLAKDDDGWKPKAGHIYANPDNSAETWRCTNGGNWPKWAKRIVAEGKEPLDKGPITDESMPGQKTVAAA